MKTNRITSSFFYRDVLEVAPDLLGKSIVRKGNGSINRFMITEVEAYRGEEDLACHASKGRTDRTEVMYSRGGLVYVYIIYGIHWMLNFVTGENDNPQAVLIRGIDMCKGPGRVSRMLKIDKTFYGEDLALSERIWLQDINFKPVVKSGSRIGVNYSGPYWSSLPWRFWINGH